MARSRDTPHEDCYTWLAPARKKAGLTQKRLAQMAGLSRNYVWQLENGWGSGSPATQHKLRYITFRAANPPAWPPPPPPAQDRTTLLYQALKAAGHAFGVSIAEIRGGAGYQHFTSARVAAHYIMGHLGFFRQETAWAINCHPSSTYYFDSRYENMSEEERQRIQDALLWVRSGQAIDKRSRDSYLVPNEITEETT